jgi:hypothetical protein
MTILCNLKNLSRTFAFGSPRWFMVLGIICYQNSSLISLEVEYFGCSDTVLFLFGMKVDKCEMHGNF